MNINKVNEKRLEEIGLLQKHDSAARDPNQYYVLIEGGGD